MLEANFEVFQFTGYIVRLTLCLRSQDAMGQGSFRRQALSYAIQQEGFGQQHTGKECSLLPVARDSGAIQCVGPERGTMARGNNP